MSTLVVLLFVCCLLSVVTCTLLNIVCYCMLHCSPWRKTEKINIHPHVHPTALSYVVQYRATNQNLLTYLNKKCNNKTTNKKVRKWFVMVLFWSTAAQPTHSDGVFPSVLFICCMTGQPFMTELFYIS